MRSTSPSDSRALRGLARRVRWRAHWALRGDRPLVLREWWDGMSIELPRSGSAATVYYRTFPSAAIAGWMSALLAPGMSVVDVGAHVGVYAILAARLVGPDGPVHAIEPQRDYAELVDRNGARNALANLHAHALALDEDDGRIEFVIDPRSRGGFAASSSASATTTVAARTLESFAAGERLERIDLLKLDAAGNELAVLRGAGEQLGPLVRSVICKLYHPDVIAERFATGTGPADVVDHLAAHGYRVELEDGRTADRDALDRAFGAGEYTIPALARRA